MPNFGIIPPLTTSSSFQLNVKVNENATLYYVLLPSNMLPPNKALIKQGKDFDGNDALSSGNSALKADKISELEFTGLTEDTNYGLALFIEDAAENSTDIHFFPVKTNSSSID